MIGSNSVLSHQLQYLIGGWLGIYASGEIMQADVLCARARNAALSVLQLIEQTRSTTYGGEVLSRQLIRSATSVAANYRSARRAKSARDFVYKMSIVVEETDESVFWLEMLRDARIISEQTLNPHLDEYNQLLRIFSASHKTAKSNLVR